MAQRVAEEVVRPRRLGPKVLLRVDLHGVSRFGPRSAHHTLIRWEWIEDIAVEAGVTVRSSGASVHFPPGAFGLEPAVLAERLEAARGIDQRTDVIASLNAR
ncbi:MAG TPA: hypothetical protein VG455_02415 [Acidimicrobiales bacterium]|nr:hypothetical protein [Acidimicrobiales bacterium]